MEITEKIEKQLKERMNTWYPVLKEWIQTEDATEVFKQLKIASQQGKNVAPQSVDLWNAFRECPRNKFRILMLGYCPYHTFKDGKPVADGIMFSNGYTKPGQAIQPSLEAFYEGVSKDIGIPIRVNDLQWLSSQGILMLNSQLTVEEGKVGSHPFWDTFTSWFIKEVINKQERGLICVFYGSVAAKYEKLINPMQHYTKIVQHPAAPSHAGKEPKDWEHDNVFSWINKILKENNGDIIDWTNQQLPF